MASRPLFAGILAATLCACGGSSIDDPWLSNPASGIYSGADSLGNLVSALILPQGRYYFITSRLQDAKRLNSLSTGVGSLDIYVFADPRLLTTDLATGSAVNGSLLVTYTQESHIEADVTYVGGKQSIHATYLNGSRGHVAPGLPPTSGLADFYLPRLAQPHLHVPQSAWSFDPGTGRFHLDGAGCAVDGNLSIAGGSSATSIAANASPGCALQSAELVGHAWKDTHQGRFYLAFIPASSSVVQSPLVVALSL